MTGPALNQTLKTEQTLSPQMLQSLALLPMPITELREFVQHEIESNPALEIPAQEFGNHSPVSENEQRSLDDRMDDADSSVYEQMSFGTYDPEASDRKQQMIENTAPRGESLSEHLMVQLIESPLDASCRQIGELLIGNLDANGFLIVPLQTLFEDKDFSKEDIEETLETVQGFDPYGICVADFKESLVLQAKLLGLNGKDLELVSELIDNRLDQLKSGKFNEIALALGISPEEVQDFYSFIKTLTPFPGRSYDMASETYIVPEFSVRRRDDVLELRMSRGNLPDLEISPEFSALAEGLSGSEAKEANSYIKDKIRQAKTLISQVRLRYDTLQKAAQALVSVQSRFFFNGPQYLKSLTLKQVADMIGVHETTMSRLTQNKYVDTDWGIFPMKYFFSQGVGEDVSRNAVKEMIAQILKEDPKLSDQKISDRLAQQGIKCARRTVSKYRAELNIDSSFVRN